MVVASGEPVSLLEWERDLARLESRVRPIDLSLGRERAVLGERLTGEEMHVILEALVASGKLEPTPS